MKRPYIFLLSALLILVVLPLCIVAQVKSDFKSLEHKFDSQLNAENLKVWMKHLSAHPHHVGSPWDKSNAEFIADRFKSWGYETKIEEFYVLFPTPKLRKLEMTAPERFTAKLEEAALKEDSTSDQIDEQLAM